MERSSFNPEFQNNNLESKIVVALERLAEAFRVALWEESKQSGLSPSQIQILIFLHYHDLEHCRVTYLAREFNLTKPTVSDVVKVLEKKGLIKKVVLPEDTRSFSVILTKAGQSAVERTANFAFSIRQPIANMEAKAQKELFENLYAIIANLQKSDFIAVQRMCFNCQSYSNKKVGIAHYCKFLERSLTEIDLRIDCPEHQTISHSTLS